MRNPLESWEKSDSTPCNFPNRCLVECKKHQCEAGDHFYVGPNDLNLMMKLRKAGTDHRKFMRMIVVYVDILAPLYWWKEFDTYKVGTVANSCSTMHCIHKKEFTLDDFSHEHLDGDGKYPFMIQLSGDPRDTVTINAVQYLMSIIELLNQYREKYLKTKDKFYWWQMIQLLPTSYNQKRTVMLNYEVLANIYKSRKDHKLDEWNDFCDWIKTLPCSKLIVGNTPRKRDTFSDALEEYMKKGHK